MQLLDYSAEFWAFEATLEELHQAAMSIEEWTEDHAEVLDGAYLYRTTRLLEHPRTDSVKEASRLADVLDSAGHDLNKPKLAHLPKEYYGRWNALRDLLVEFVHSFNRPSEVLDRKYVTEILHALVEAGGRLPQSRLTMIANEGQRSSTLKYMENFDLIDRVPGPGNTRTVVITGRGLAAIGKTEAAIEQVAAPAAAAVEARRPLSRAWLTA